MALETVMAAMAVIKRPASKRAWESSVFTGVIAGAVLGIFAGHVAIGILVGFALGSFIDLPALFKGLKKK